MKLSNSYFANWRKFNKEAVPISIALNPPVGFKGKCYPLLAPSIEMLSKWKHGEINEEQYAKIYREYLDTLNKEEVRKDLEEMSEGRDVILLCFEKQGNFCHRYIAEEWLNS